MLQLMQSCQDGLLLETNRLRIFVGMNEFQVVPFRVLEYSIRKSTTVPVEISPMMDLPSPPQQRSKRGFFEMFAFYRLMIPALTGYEGRALYFDAESLVLGDVAELASLPFDDHSILCTPENEPDHVFASSSGCGSDAPTALLIDCDRLRGQINDLASLLEDDECDYDELLEALCNVVPTDVAETVPGEWNHTERYEPGFTKLLRFGNGPDKPWINDRHPFTAVWTACFEEAVSCGAVAPLEIDAAVRSGSLKPSLQRIAPIRLTTLRALK